MTSLLNIIYNENEKYVIKGVSSDVFLSEILEDACNHFKLNIYEYELKLKNNKKLDLSNSIKYAKLPHNSKLYLIKRKNKMKGNVRIRLEQLNGATFQLTLSPNLSLWEMLIIIEEKYSVNLTELYSVPEPEKNELFELVINVPGYMQPIITYMNREFKTNDELKSKKLSSLGLFGGGAGAKLRIKHVYTPPKLSEEEKKDTIKIFNEKFQHAMNTNQLYNQHHHHHHHHHHIHQKQNIIKSNKIIDRKRCIYLSKSQLSNVMKNDNINNDKVNDENEEEDFYDVSVSDAMHYAAGIYRITNPSLVSQKYQSTQSSLHKSDIEHTTLRVLLSNELIIQANFHPQETISNVNSYIQSCLLETECKFHLMTTVPHIILDPDKTLMKLDLLPAAWVHVRFFDDDIKASIDESLLTKEAKLDIVKNKN